MEQSKYDLAITIVIMCMAGSDRSGNKQKAILNMAWLVHSVLLTQR